MDRRRFLTRSATAASTLGLVSLGGEFACASSGSGLQVVPQATRRPTGRAPGGSNYGWFKLDGCDREPFGVVNRFDQNAALIRSQLVQMHAQGQRRLQLPIYHRRGGDTGTVMDSTGGILSPQNRRNLNDLLAAVSEAGFDEIQVAFLPHGPNDPSTWQAWDDDLYQENWKLIQNIRPTVVEAGVPYRIDLSNEAVPAPSQPLLLAYAQRLWADYTHMFGRDDTCGFSTIGSADRIRRIPEVYGSEAPHVFDFHFLGHAWDDHDEYAQFVEAHRLMNDMGYDVQGWTVSAVYYDDPVAADGLRRAVADTGRTVHYLLQWPRARAAACEHVSIAPPSDFTAYAEQGF